MNATLYLQCCRVVKLCNPINNFIVRENHLALHNHNYQNYSSKTPVLPSQYANWTFSRRCCNGIRFWKPITSNECIVLTAARNAHLSLGLINIWRQVEQRSLLCSYKLAQVNNSSLRNCKCSVLCLSIRPNQLTSVVTQ